MHYRPKPRENLATAVAAMMEVSPLADAIAGMSDERWEEARAAVEQSVVAMNNAGESPWANSADA